MVYLWSVKIMIHNTESSFIFLCAIVLFHFTLLLNGSWATVFISHKSTYIMHRYFYSTIDISSILVLA